MCQPGRFTDEYHTHTNLRYTNVLFSERELAFMFAICYLPSVCRLSVCLSVVCNARAPYSGGCNFQKFFYGIWYLGHRKFYGDRSRGTSPSGELNPRGVAKYSDFGPIEGYISETVQDTR